MEIRFPIIERSVSVSYTHLLTKAEERTMIWLAGWEESTVDHLLSVIEKTARIRAEKKGGYAHKSKDVYKRQVLFIQILSKVVQKRQKWLNLIIMLEDCLKILGLR